MDWQSILRKVGEAPEKRVRLGNDSKATKAKLGSLLRSRIFVYEISLLFRPATTHSFQIYIDRKNLTVVLPINGFAVPFHINAIKNAVKNDEGDYTLLRINFQTPGQVAGKKEDTVSTVYF
jgi:nucleosome binding factor SPN SPT16 subunit